MHTYALTRPLLLATTVRPPPASHHLCGECMTNMNCKSAIWRLASYSEFTQKLSLFINRAPRQRVGKYLLAHEGAVAWKAQYSICLPHFHMHTYIFLRRNVISNALQTNCDVLVFRFILSVILQWFHVVMELDAKCLYGIELSACDLACVVFNLCNP